MPNEKLDAVIQARLEGVDKFLADAARMTKGIDQLTRAASTQGKGIFGSTNPVTKQPALSPGTLQALQTATSPNGQAPAVPKVLEARMNVAIKELENFVRQAKAADPKRDDLGSTKQAIEELRGLRSVSTAVNGLVAATSAEEKVEKGNLAEREKQARLLARATADQIASTRLGGRSTLPVVTPTSSPSELAARRLATAQNRLADAAEKRLAQELFTTSKSSTPADAEKLVGLQQREAAAEVRVVEARQKLAKAIDAETAVAQRAAEAAARPADTPQGLLTLGSTKGQVAQVRADSAKARLDAANEKVATATEQAAQGLKGAEERRQSAVIAQSSAAASYVDAQRKATHLLENESRQRQRAADAAQTAQVQAPRLNSVDARSTATDVAERATQVAAYKLEAATSRLAAAREASALGDAKAAATINTLISQEIAAQDQVVAADRRLAAARERAAKAADLQGSQVTSTGLQKQIDNFQLGFKGQREAPYAEQLGQAFKFSVFYGTAYKLLFGITQTFTQALTEGIAFEQALTDLKVATGASGEEAQKLAEGLGKQAAAAGASPSQGVQIGARAVGLYGLSGTADTDERNRVANLSADVISKLAVGSKQQPVDLQNSIAAITQSLGMGPTGLLRVADLDAYLTKRFGTAQGSTFDTVGQAGVVGKAAGFSNEELFSIAADLQARTGQGGSTVGGYLAQIFTRGGEGTLTSVTSKYGIDQQKDLADQLRDLAKIYKTATPNERTQIAAVGGRGKAQNAFVALLQDYGDIESAAKDAKTKAGGSADSQFDLRMKDIGGRINVLTGDFKELAHQLGESGLLDAVGALVIVLDEGVKDLNALFEIFNLLPREVRDAIGALGLFALALKVTGREQIARDALGGIGGGRRGPAPAQFLDQYMAGASRGGFGENGLVEGAAASETRAATRGLRGISAFGSAAYEAIGPLGLAIAGFIAISEFKRAADKYKEAQDNAQAQLGSGPGYGGTSDEYSSQADDLKRARKQIAASQNGIWANITNLASFGSEKSSGNDVMADLKVREARLRDIADQVEKSVSETNGNQTGLISGFDKDGLSSSLDTIASGGGTAATQLNALAAAIKGVGDGAVVKQKDIDTGQLTEGLIESLTKGLGGTDVRGKTKAALQNVPIFGALADSVGALDIDATGNKANVHNILDPAIQSILTDQLKAMGITNLADLDPGSQAKIADSIVNSLPQGAYGDKGFASTKKTLRDNILKYLSKSVDDYVKSILGGTQLSPSEATAAVAAVLDRAKARSDARPESDFSGRIKDARRALTLVSQTRVEGDVSVPAVQQAIEEAKATLAKAQIAQIEGLRKAAVGRAGSQAEATAAGRAAVRQEIAVAVRSGNSDVLVQVIEAAGKGSIAIAQNTINEALQAAKIADRIRKRIAQALQAQQTALAGALAAAGTGTGVDLTGPTVKQLKGLQQGLNSAVPGTGGDTITGQGDTAAAIGAAKAQAGATRNGGQIALAQAAITSAKADMHDAVKGTVAYYTALSSYYSARQQLNDALREYATNRAKLASDLSDPVAQAKIDLQAARRKLAQDRSSGAGKDVITADKVDVKQQGLNVESEKFNQRLSDVQTAEQLGRVSHQAYIQYLESEHNRLASISKRTRQQQDELNQIDGLLKDAQQQMTGAFNIGDIKLPTAYEIRRYIQETANLGAAAVASAGPGQADAEKGRTTIYIDGADVGKVTALINQQVGKSSRVVTTSGRRVV